MNNHYSKIESDTEAICLFYGIDFEAMYKQIMEYAKSLGVSYDTAKNIIAYEVRNSN